MGHGQDLLLANGQDYSQAQQMPMNGPVGMQDNNIKRHFISNSPIMDSMRQPDFDMGLDLFMEQDQEKQNVNFDAMGLETTNYRYSPNRLSGHAGQGGNVMGSHNIQVPYTIENELQSIETTDEN